MKTYTLFLVIVLIELLIVSPSLVALGPQSQLQELVAALHPSFNTPPSDPLPPNPNHHHNHAEEQPHAPTDNLPRSLNWYFHIHPAILFLGIGLTFIPFTLLQFNLLFLIPLILLSLPLSYKICVWAKPYWDKTFLSKAVQGMRTSLGIILVGLIFFGVLEILSHVLMSSAAFAMYTQPSLLIIAIIAVAVYALPDIYKGFVSIFKAIDLAIEKKNPLRALGMNFVRGLSLFLFILLPFLGTFHISLALVALIAIAIQLAEVMKMKAKEYQQEALNQLKNKKIPSIILIAQIDDHKFDQPQQASEEDVQDLLNNGHSVTAFVLQDSWVPKIDGIIASVHNGTQVLVDQKEFNGEQTPVPMGKGQALEGGSYITRSAIDLVVTRVGEHSKIGQIEQSLKRFQNKGLSEVEKFSNKIGQYFLLTIFIFGGLAFLLTFLSTGSSSSAFIAALTVFVVICPCAFLIGMPLAFSATRQNLAEAAKISVNDDRSFLVPRVMIFDKTNTITDGVHIDTDFPWLWFHSSLNNIHACCRNSSLNEWLEVAALAEYPQEQNPYALAIINTIIAEGYTDRLALENAKSQIECKVASSGAGIVSTIHLPDEDPITVFLGSAEALQQEYPLLPEAHKRAIQDHLERMNVYLVFQSIESFIAKESERKEKLYDRQEEWLSHIQTCLEQKTYEPLAAFVRTHHVAVNAEQETQLQNIFVTLINETKKILTPIIFYDITHQKPLMILRATNTLRGGAEEFFQKFGKTKKENFYHRFLNGLSRAIFRIESFPQRELAIVASGDKKKAVQHVIEHLDIRLALAEVKPNEKAFLVQIFKQAPWLERFQDHLEQQKHPLIFTYAEFKNHLIEHQFSTAEELQHMESHYEDHHAEHKQKHSKTNVVFFMGDGSNDRQAMQVAHAGISFNGAYSIGQGDIILTQDHAQKPMFEQLSYLLEHYRSSYTIILSTIFWVAIVWNVIMLTLIFTGILGPALAAVLHALNTVVVIILALTLMSKPREFFKKEWHNLFEDHKQNTEPSVAEDKKEKTPLEHYPLFHITSWTQSHSVSASKHSHKEHPAKKSIQQEDSCCASPAFLTAALPHAPLSAQRRPSIPIADLNQHNTSSPLQQSFYQLFQAFEFHQNTQTFQDITLKFGPIFADLNISAEAFIAWVLAHQNTISFIPDAYSTLMWWEQHDDVYTIHYHPDLATYQHETALIQSELLHELLEIFAISQAVAQKKHAPHWHRAYTLEHTQKAAFEAAVVGNQFLLLFLLDTNMHHVLDAYRDFETHMYGSDKHPLSTWMEKLSQRWQNLHTLPTLSQRTAQWQQQWQAGLSREVTSSLETLFDDTRKQRLKAQA